MAVSYGQLLQSLKEQCNIVDDADRPLLERICRAAVAHTERNLGFAIDDVVEFPTGTPDDLQHAVLMLAAHWYENREATLVGVTAQAIPFGYDDVVVNHRSYTFGG